MQETTITSRGNPLLQRARAVRDGRATDLIFVEGLRLSEEALSSKLKIEAVIYSEEIAHKERARHFLEQVATATNRLVSVSEKLLGTISFTKTPQGIVVLASRPETAHPLVVRPKPIPLLVVLHRINNPVNVGAILRTAEAAGATGAIATAQTSDPFSPKSLRGAMGSAFRLPIWYGLTYEESINWCNENRVTTVAADAEGRAPYTDFDWKQPSALILGPESEGLSAEEIAATNYSAKVPMKGSVESLNVAVTAGVLLYEARRQRG